MINARETIERLEDANFKKAQYIETLREALEAAIEYIEYTPRGKDILAGLRSALEETEDY